MVDSKHLINFFRKMSCLMVGDLLYLAKELEAKLSNSSPLMRCLKPKLTLVGSVAEGTRIGLGSELDLTMRFAGLDSQDLPPFRFKEEDPFHLYKGVKVPDELEGYFGAQDQFQLGNFKEDLSMIIESSLFNIFKCKRNPQRLRINPNEHSIQNIHFYPLHDCNDCSTLYKKNFVNIQCKNCLWAVSKTKLGLCLQFLWSKNEEDEAEACCSMDLVPTFRFQFPHLSTFCYI